jgi:hypothetical protein
VHRVGHFGLELFALAEERWGAERQNAPNGADGAEDNERRAKAAPDTESLQHIHATPHG